jgi:hypothetical protein
MQGYMPNMQMMGMSGQCCPMMEMPQTQLESMYPKVYIIIYPRIKHSCDMFNSMYGMVNPTCKQLERMVDDIYKSVEAEVDAEMSLSMDESGRQIGFGGRRLLRDLISILLIRQLLQGRTPFPYAYPYTSPYAGFPGYYGIGY